MNEIHDLLIEDSYGCKHAVSIKHYPQFGFSNASHAGKMIAHIKREDSLHQPTGDNKEEWDRYDKLYSDWKDSITEELNRACKEYFNDY